jgi:hypothetical protein
MKGPVTLGFDPARFQKHRQPATGLWQLPGPDSHRQDDELTNNKIHRYVTASSPALLGARKAQG